jgi:hypothetical protein
LWPKSLDGELRMLAKPKKYGLGLTLVRDGKAVKTPVDTALGDDKWVEVDKLKIDDPWVKATGDEQVIVGDTSELSDGEAVQVAH